MTDVAQLLLEVQRTMPTGQRSPDEVATFLAQLKSAWDPIRQSLRDAIFAGSGGLETYEQLAIEADAFETRLEAYRSAAEAASAEVDLAPQIVPLFDRISGPDPITGKLLHVPDSVFPWAFGNQLGSLDTTATFLDDLKESMAELPERAARGAASIVGSSPWLLGLAAVVVGAWLYSRSAGGARG